MGDTVLGGVGAGAMKGASLGATLGSVVPGVGNAVGAIAGGVTGAIGGGIKSNRALKKEAVAEGYMPAYEDPIQASRLAEIDQISKNIQAGTDPAVQTALGQIGGQMAQTQNKLARVTGGNAGQTVDALIKAQRAGGEAANTAIASGQSRLPFFRGLGQDLANRIEQRALELKLLNRAQNSAEAAQAQKENVINNNAVTSMGLGQNELGEALNSPQFANAANRISTLFNNLKLGQNGEMAGAGQSVTNPGMEVIGGQNLTNAFEALPTLPG